MGQCAQCTFQIRSESVQTVVCLCEQEALQGPGKVLIHCSQGVSRSTTLLIAFLMWRSDHAYDEVFQHVKAKRGVANPNIGFICQVWSSFTNHVHHKSACIGAFGKAYASLLLLLLTTWEYDRQPCKYPLPKLYCVSTSSTPQLSGVTSIVCLGACS